MNRRQKKSPYLTRRPKQRDKGQHKGLKQPISVFILP